ncbi:MAG TPA: SURF1 family cytochrome oxidase biogenesis protein, partial [Acetobacteraceae bacterium]
MTFARRLLVPALSTLAMLVLLLGLGSWQVERLRWKTDLLARIDAAEAHPAVELQPDSPPYAKVRARGILRSDLSALYGAEGRGTRLGAQLLSVLERPGADPLLVDRGWVAGLPPPAAPA